jgi:DNA adenine methylase
MANASLTPPLKWHGGKHYLASRIVTLMPPHLHYIEPYGGGLAVLLARDPAGVSEVVNDLNGDLTNFWHVIRTLNLFEDFVRVVHATPFSEPIWRQACELLAGPEKDQVRRAVAFFIFCRQSHAGRMKDFAALTRNRLRRGMNEQASAWLGAVEGLPAVHNRLKQVVVLNRPALEVIRQQDGPQTLFYCDPPYLPETRTAREVYGPLEMTRAEHEELLATLAQCRGKVMLSGYPSALYDDALASWTRHTFDLPNNAAGGKEKARETEVLWCNF